MDRQAIETRLQEIDAALEDGDRGIQRQRLRVEKLTGRSSQLASVQMLSHMEEMQLVCRQFRDLLVAYLARLSEGQ